MKKLFVLFVMILMVICIFGCSETNTKNLKKQSKDDKYEEALEYTLENYGGAQITYGLSNEEVDADEAVEKCIYVLQRRLEGLNFSNATVEKNGEYIVVNLPGMYDDPSDVSNILG